MNYRFFPIFPILFFFIFSEFLYAQMSDFPSDAVIGKCYKKCIESERYETISQNVLVKEAYKKIVVEPAVYDTVYQEILEEEGYVIFDILPAEYTTADIELIMEPASSEFSYIPPVFETQEEYVMLEPAYYKWAKKVDDKGCFDQRTIEDCVVWCWEIIPPRLDTLFEEVVKQHAKPIEVVIPAVVKSFMTTLVLKPATLKRVIVPPKYRTIEVLKLVQPARAIEVDVSAEYQIITVRKRIEEKGFADWVEVDCEQISYVEE